ncbi:MAG TPA: cell division protein ZapA [Maritimibacter sp.]|nr:cell division protein ZapA [Maritimibacter sp.]
MPEVTISIGGREFEVACAEGEEHYLKSAAAMLDAEAQTMLSQIRHLTESRLLLMSGLMLADKTAGVDDSLKVAEQKIAALEAELAEARRAAGGVPDTVVDTMAEIAAQAEALADQIETKVS